MFPKIKLYGGGNNYGYEFKGFVAWDKCIRGALNYSQVELASISEGLGTVSKLVTESIYQEKNKIHPTQKPVNLYKWLLNNYAKEGDIILDTHVGSASSLIACYELGFDYVGFEINKQYYDLAVKRIEEEKAQIRWNV